MRKEQALARREAATVSLRAGRNTLEHQSRLAAITAEEAVAKAEIHAACSVIDTATAQPQNTTVAWLLRRYFKD